MKRLTQAYLRSLTNEGLQKLRLQYDILSDQSASPAHDARGTSKTWQHRLAMIMEEQGRRWGKA